ncbi:hypothetical protein DUI87_30694 [Hirundo rustica rustica]|uniref:Reverse transcriptase/retrotransposon-derived protein RNase H-like domain-containing protein n=1 Tax=Hirundo rustica rustica TaxID=333673 RepID=A0A3M0IXX0_HIRRU|nr:hypothetical protein DUI87_30694 [Hirundo rustica rustica]
MAAVSWALAYAYRTLLETVGQQTEAGGKGYKSTATPVTQATANTPVMKPAAKLEPELSRQLNQTENTAAEVFEEGKEIIQILLEASFTIKKSKVKRPAYEIQFLGVKWQDGWRQIPTEVINKITAMSPPTNKKETQAFLSAIGF